MDEIYEVYSVLYSRIKTTGLNFLLKTESLNKYTEAIRKVAKLPHPIEANFQDIAEVCRQCIMGELEYIYNEEHIGELAKELRSMLENEREHKLTHIDFPASSRSKRRVPSSDYLNEVRHILEYNTKLTKRIFALSTRASSQLDITLKGRCLACNSDLEIVLPANSQDLHIKCRNPSPQAGCLDKPLNITK